MALEQDFLDSMTETVNLAPRTGSDGFGQPTYGSNVAHAARIERSPELVRDVNGSEVVSSARVYTVPAAVASNSFGFARITMPDSTTPPILRADPQRDDDGAHHLRLSVA